MGLESQPSSSNRTLNEQLAVLLDKRQRDSKLRKLTISQSGSKDFSSNDYLSLRTDPFIKRRLIQEISTAEYIGSGGSRLLDGNSAYYEELETQIARFHRAEAGLLFNSGYDANSAVFGTLPQPGDIVVYDELIHASVHNGIKLCRASQRVPFRHNSISNAKNILGDLSLRYPNKNIFVAVESVYSMDGDRAPLKEFVEILSNIPNSYLIVDEAHSTGVLGGNGQGLCHSLGIEDKVAVRVHTFGKAMAANGGKLWTFYCTLNRELTCSHCLGFECNALIFDKLRTPSHLFYGHELSCLGCY
jgi:8-amino-7-oxononanoate synthase